MKRPKHYIIMLFCSLLFISCAKQLSHEKAIVGTTELIPNYLMHMLVVGDVWSTNSAYANKYSKFVRTDAIQYIHNNRQLIAWGNGTGGPLASPLFFIPSALGLNNESELKAYFSDVSSGFNDGFRTFKRVYSKRLPGKDLWWTSELSGKNRRTYKKTFDELATVFIENFNSYKENVWPIEKRKLEKTSKKLTAHFKGRKSIEQWEETVRLSFPGDTFFIVLTSANASPAPSANDLSRTRYNFYYSPQGFTALTRFINHEICTNLLYDTVRKLYGDRDINRALHKANLGQNVIWQAFEALAEFYNKRNRTNMGKDAWTGTSFSGDNLNFEPFYKIYNTELKQDPSQSAETLMRKGVMGYIKTHRN